MARSEENAKYGTWFGNKDAEYVIKRCDEQISKYQEWIKNLEQLKKEKLAEEAERRKDEIKDMLAALTPEQRNEFLSGIN